MVSGIDGDHLRECVVAPVLQILHPVIPYSQDAEELLMGTAAHESRMGTFLKQNDGGGSPRGPALGIYQMEPQTHNDIYDNYLKHNTELKFALRGLAVGWPSPAAGELVWNLGYATAMARIHYRRVKAPLPRWDDLDGLARYWKQYYNTMAGKGTVEGFVNDYVRYVK